MINRIILDLDDVLNSLTLHILGHYGCDIGVYDYHKFPVEVGYNIISACIKLGGDVPLQRSPKCLDLMHGSEMIPDVPAFWDEVTRADLWRTAPWTLECDWLINQCVKLVGEKEVYIATSPTKDPKSHSHKVEWINENLPKFLHRQYFITPRKWLLSKPGVMLFDDCEANCENWRNCQLSGEAFLVPRPWNKKHGLDTRQSLEDEFLRLSLTS